MLGTKMTGMHFMFLTESMITALAPTPEDFLVRWGLLEFLKEHKKKKEEVGFMVLIK